MNIYAGNLSYNMTEQNLLETFSQFGEVTSARVITDKFSGRSKGFGFVEMANRADGEKAIAALNGKDVLGRELKVSEASAPENKPRQQFSDRREGRSEYRDNRRR